MPLPRVLVVALFVCLWTGCSKTDWENLGPRPVHVALSYFPSVVGLGQTFSVEADVVWGIGGGAVPAEHLDQTYVEWGPVQGYVLYLVYGSARRGTAHVYYPRAPDEVGVIYLRACARVNGVLYSSPFEVIGVERGVVAPGPPPASPAPPPPVSVPPPPGPPQYPPRTCETLQVSGGNEADTREIEMGQTSGTYVFKYETYYVADRVIITYEGDVHDLGCIGTQGEVSRVFSYSGASSKITVQVVPNCAGTIGTAWYYIVGCPQ